VDQRVRPALPVPWRAPGSSKAHPFVEANRLIILLVHIGGHGGMHGESMPNKRSANSPTMEGWIDEQRLHVSGVDEHEGYRAILLIGDDPKGSMRQEAAHLFIDRDAILAGEEVVCGVDGFTPDFDYASALIRARGPDREHVCPMP
jgi:hypothetical protein